MASYFFDSSALVKRYVLETGSAWIAGITNLAAGHKIFLVRVSGVEVVSALVRKVPALSPALLAQVLAEFKYDFQKQYQRLAVTDSVIARGMQLAESHRLRGYDAIQLAAAVDLLARQNAAGFSPFTFVSADLRLLAAGVAEGLSVDNPNLYP